MKSSQSHRSLVAFLTGLIALQVSIVVAQAIEAQAVSFAMQHKVIAERYSELTLAELVAARESRPIVQDPAWLEMIEELQVSDDVLYALAEPRFRRSAESMIDDGVTSFCHVDPSWLLICSDILSYPDFALRMLSGDGFVRAMHSFELLAKLLSVMLRDDTIRDFLASHDLSDVGLLHCPSGMYLSDAVKLDKGFGVYRPSGAVPGYPSVALDLPGELGSSVGPAVISQCQTLMAQELAGAISGTSEGGTLAAHYADCHDDVACVEQRLDQLIDQALAECARGASQRMFAGISRVPHSGWVSSGLTWDMVRDTAASAVVESGTDSRFAAKMFDTAIAVAGAYDPQIVETMSGGFKFQLFNAGRLFTSILTGLATDAAASFLNALATFTVIYEHRDDPAGNQFAAGVWGANAGFSKEVSCGSVSGGAGGACGALWDLTMEYLAKKGSGQDTPEPSPEDPTPEPPKPGEPEPPKPGEPESGQQDIRCQVYGPETMGVTSSVQLSQLDSCLQDCEALRLVLEFQKRVCKEEGIYAEACLGFAHANVIGTCPDPTVAYPHPDGTGLQCTVTSEEDMASALENAVVEHCQRMPYGVVLVAAHGNNANPAIDCVNGFSARMPSMSPDDLVAALTCRYAYDLEGGCFGTREALHALD